MRNTRHDLSRNHPIFNGYEKLNDDDVVKVDDETACVSELLAVDSQCKWCRITEDDSDVIGKTVRQLCEDDGDADGWERVFRRRQREIETE